MDSKKQQLSKPKIASKFLYDCSKIQKFKKSTLNLVNNTQVIRQVLKQHAEKKTSKNLKLTFIALSASDLIDGIAKVEKYLTNLSYFFIKSVDLNKYYDVHLHYLINLTHIHTVLEANKYCYSNTNLYDLNDARRVFYLAEHMANNAVFGYQKTPQKTKLFTVIRSAFIFKKTREQFGLTRINYFTSINITSIIHQQLLLQIINLLKLPCELKIQINN